MHKSQEPLYFQIIYLKRFTCHQTTESLVIKKKKPTESLVILFMSMLYLSPENCLKRRARSCMMVTS